MAKPTVLCVIGTRPEAIKMAPVVTELRRDDRLSTVLATTGQHDQILLDALASFSLKPDHDLKLLKQGQSLADLTARGLQAVDGLLIDIQPSLVLGQGDTTTTFVSALGSFYRGIPFGHIEAGLRTPTIDNPFPEEFNRRAVSLVARLHFAPTEWAKENLLRERIDPATVFVTGNTVVDAVLHVTQGIGREWYEGFDGRLLLLTTHRRENWGEPQERIGRAVRRLVDEFADTRLVVAMHPNPSVRETLVGELGGHDRIDLIEPPDYADFVRLMKRCTLIFSDSGGVQEEAPAFGIPVLVLRDNTERPEGVTAGTARLVGTSEENIYQQAHQLLSSPAAYQEMSVATSPYGDGQAATRIHEHVVEFLGQNK